MKKAKGLLSLVILVVIAAMVVPGCASGPELGEPTALQQILNALPELTIAGKQLKLEFGGDTWIARESGKDVLAGTFTSEDTAEGSILRLKQTHVYTTGQALGMSGEGGWVEASGLNIELEYKAGPPSTLSLYNS